MVIDGKISPKKKQKNNTTHGKGSIVLERERVNIGEHGLAGKEKRQKGSCTGSAGHRLHWGGGGARREMGGWEREREREGDVWRHLGGFICVTVNFCVYCGRVRRPGPTRELALHLL